MDDEIVLGIAIGVVRERIAQCLQPCNVGGRESAPRRDRTRRFAQVVAECRDDRPELPFAGEMAVDEHAGAYPGAGVDRGVERRMNRQVAGEMMIEILHAHAAGKQCDERVAIDRR